MSSAKVKLLAGRTTVVFDTDIVKTSKLCDAILAAEYKQQARETVGSSERDGSHADQSQEFRIDFQTNIPAQSASRIFRVLESV